MASYKPVPIDLSEI